MKKKMTFNLDNTEYSDFDELVKIIGCIEEVERIFQIEFASGIEYENGEEKLVFASDYLFTDQEESFLNKYDGLVECHYFRNKTNKKIYDLNKSDCIFNITYDPYHHMTGSEQFSNPKIIVLSNPKIIVEKNKHLKTRS